MGHWFLLIVKRGLSPVWCIQLIARFRALARILTLGPRWEFSWGVCVEADPVRGIDFMRQAANQGLPAALEQLGRYYSKGTLVQQDRKRAVMFLREAAALGNLKAQMQLAELFIDGYGSPYDYQDAYHWLYNAITDDKSTHSQIAVYLTELEKLMHPRAVRAARKPLDS